MENVKKFAQAWFFISNFYAKMCDLRQLKNTQPLARSVHFPCLENLPAQAEAPRQNRGTLNTVSHHTHSAHTEVHTGLFRNMLHQKKEDLKKMWSWKQITKTMEDSEPKLSKIYGKIGVLGLL